MIFFSMKQNSHLIQMSQTLGMVHLTDMILIALCEGQRLTSEDVQRFSNLQTLELFLYNVPHCKYFLVSHQLQYFMVHL